MSDVSKQIREWWQSPFGKLIAIWVLAETCFFAIIMSWGDRHPISAFFESLVALIMYSFGGLGLITAIWAGGRVSEKVQSNMLGWIAGIAVRLGVSVSIFLIAHAIPGVGWRFERISNTLEDY